MVSVTILFETAYWLTTQCKTTPATPTTPALIPQTFLASTQITSTMIIAQVATARARQNMITATHTTTHTVPRAHPLARTPIDATTSTTLHPPQRPALPDALAAASRTTITDLISVGKLVDWGITSCICRRETGAWRLPCGWTGGYANRRLEHLGQRW
jgi:hypothetical protein